MLASMLTIMVGSVIAPSLMEIDAHLSFQFDPGWLITLPSLGVVLFSPIVGKLHTKIGSFKMLCGGLLPYAIFGYGGIFMPNTLLLIVDRILLGGAAVAVQIAATAIIAENFFGRERMKIIAWQGMAIEAGGVIFLSVGGILGEWGWSYPFLLYLFALVCLALSGLFIPRKPHAHIQHTDQTHTSGGYARPMVTAVFLGALFAMIIFFVSFTVLPQYLPEKFQFTESDNGYLMSFISLIAVITASQMPRIAEKISAEYTIAAGFTIFAVGYLVFSFAASVWSLYAGALITGIGFGLTVPTLNHLMVEVSTLATRSKNLGLYAMGIFGGQFVSTFSGILIKDPPQLFIATACLSFLVALSLALFFRKFNPNLSLERP